MAEWSRSVIESLGGRFQILITRVGSPDKFGNGGGVTRDVTYFRGVATQLDSFASSDPFGDATAQITFPQITGFDDPDSPELEWLADFASVDIWWLPGELPGGIIVPPSSGDALAYIDGRSNQPGPLAPTNTYTLVDGVYVVTGRRGVKVFEGFIASQALNGSETDDTTQVQCQGALFQADRYLAKPFFPPTPQTLESLIAAQFDHTLRPHLRTAPMAMVYPPGWTKVAAAWDGEPNTYTANVAPGTRWSGYASRTTGAWEHSLTGFIQNQLPVMITQDDSGAVPGNQWTLLLARQNDPDFPVGRTPVLKVRDRFREPDFEYWYGTPGMSASLNRDTTQVANIIYGSGTNTDGTMWRNAVISTDGSRTDYNPLVASPQVYPIAASNKLFDPAIFAAEGFAKFDSGFVFSDAVISATQTLQRDLDAGWAGTITVKTDPAADFSRWQISAGMTMLLKGFRGTGERGVRLHVSQVQANPMQGTVLLTVDTRYRDLLNLEEALARTKDPLTPSKLLQINHQSAVIEDVQAPWDYTAGSGFMPKASKDFYAYAPVQQAFPYTDWSGKHPPFMHPEWYILCNADAPDRLSRWSGPIPILMSEAGTIARTEMYCCDKYGVLLQIPFSLSLYYINVPPDGMPKDGGGPSAFITNAFTASDPSTGQQWPPGSFLKPDPSMIVMWGNGAQPAGFSPGQYSDAGGLTGNHPTGMLTDSAPWTFRCIGNNSAFNPQAPAGQTQPAAAITIYAEIYCEYFEPVYFQGRMFRQPQGTS